MREFRSPDGITWRVEITSPGASNAIVMFNHPDGRTSRFDRYAWYLAKGPEARNVTGRLDTAKVLEALSERDLLRFFRSSFAVSEQREKYQNITA